MTGNVVFFISFIASALLLLLERAVGIGIDFHPDAITYLTMSGFITAEIYNNPLLVINHGYYLWTNLLGASPAALITANMLLFAMTNKILYVAYRRFAKSSLNSRLFRGNKHYLIYLLYIFSLYRLHLSVHILKDTFVIFLTVLMVAGTPKYKYLWLLSISVLRMFGIMYFALFLRGKPLYFTIFLTLLLSYVFQARLTGFLLEFNSADMNFRAGTLIPSFQEMGVAGIFLRMFIWPILMLSGFFVFLAPSPLFIPIALNCLVLQWWSFSTLKKPAVTVGAFGLLAILAALAPGFTSYQRYCLPILTILPLLMVRTTFIKKEG